jgi:hypothetical protein
MLSTFARLSSILKACILFVAVGFAHELDLHDALHRRHEARHAHSRAHVAR